MFEKIFVNRKALENRRKKAERRFSNSNPSESDFSPQEEKDFMKMNRPLMNKITKILKGDCHHEQIKEIIRDFKKANFDYNKFTKKYTNKVTEVYEYLKIGIKKHPEVYKNTSAELYVEAYELLQDKKLLGTVQKVSKNFNSLFKNGDVNFEDVAEEKRFAYTSGAVIEALYIALIIFLVLEMVLIVILMVQRHGELIYNSETSEENYILDMDKFEKDYASFIMNVAYPTVEFITFFKKTPASKLENASKKIIEKLGKENYSNKSGLTDKQIENLKERFGYEDFGLIVAVTVGVLLLLIVLFPALRNFLYYIESSKVDMSDELLENAELLKNNIPKLREKLEAATTPAERKHWEEVIAKQERYIKELTEKANKIYVRERETETIAESAYTADQQTFDEQDKEDSRPSILI